MVSASSKDNETNKETEVPEITNPPLSLHQLGLTIKIVYKDTELHKTVEFYTKWFSVCPNITSKFVPLLYLTVSSKL
jgi:hypothetical protein